VTIAEVQDEVVDEFSFFDDWQERYKHIIELGRELPPLPDEFKTEDNLVRGCQSQVWLHAETRDDGSVYFQADSDALIVRGLVALTVRVYSGHPPAEVAATPPEFLERIGMSEHLSMTRANGLRALIKKIKIYALAYQTIGEREN